MDPRGTEILQLMETGREEDRYDWKTKDNASGGGDDELHQ